MITTKRAEKIAKSFAGKKILVVGDLMLDRYVSGSVHRISPEAPVPVVLVSGQSCSPGGAANVSSNIQSLGGQAIMVGTVGRDAGADYYESAALANCAAGVVVGKLGTATCSPEELLASIE